MAIPITTIKSAFQIDLENCRPVELFNRIGMYQFYISNGIYRHECQRKDYERAIATILREILSRLTVEEMADVEPRDYPDFSNAYIKTAYVDDFKRNETFMCRDSDLEILNNEPSIVNEFAHAHHQTMMDYYNQD